MKTFLRTMTISALIWGASIVPSFAGVMAQIPTPPSKILVSMEMKNKIYVVHLTPLDNENNFYSDKNFSPSTVLIDSMKNKSTVKNWKDLPVVGDYHYNDKKANVKDMTTWNSVFLSDDGKELVVDYYRY